ncbi:hypothetical protein IWQ62_004908 [Dispira parvispora]|uniref:Uncharacterized protein n=1 Tax=Dispira parvispora TaxID=1520584 RepID=A0A9W8ANV5_9FUNG|nr:hypothetical protein IWQ62_004908 [Dispira parvispora]
MHIFGVFGIVQAFICPIQLALSVVLATLYFKNSGVYQEVAGIMPHSDFSVIHNVLYPLVCIGVLGNAVCSVLSSCMLMIGLCYTRKWYAQIDGDWRRLARRRLTDTMVIKCVAEQSDQVKFVILDWISRRLLKWDGTIHRMRCTFCGIMCVTWVSICTLLFLHSGCVSCDNLGSILTFTRANLVNSSAGTFDAGDGLAIPKMGSHAGPVSLDFINACNQEKVELGLSIFNCFCWICTFFALAYKLRRNWDNGNPAYMPTSKNSADFPIIYSKR